MRNRAPRPAIDFCKGHIATEQLRETARESMREIDWQSEEERLRKGTRTRICAWVYMCVRLACAYMWVHQYPCILLQETILIYRKKSIKKRTKVERDRKRIKRIQTEKRGWTNSWSFFPPTLQQNSL